MLPRFPLGFGQGVQHFPREIGGKLGCRRKLGMVKESLHVSLRLTPAKDKQDRGKQEEPGGPAQWLCRWHCEWNWFSPSAPHPEAYSTKEQSCLKQ
jgi:hypothetical protein